MKTAYVVVSLTFLLEGCSLCYRVVNNLIGVGDTFVLYGRAAVGIYETSFPEAADFRMDGTEENGALVYRAVFCSQKVRYHYFALAYECPKRNDGTLYDFFSACEDFHFNGSVDVEIRHDGNLYERKTNEVGYPMVYGETVERCGSVWHSLGRLDVVDLPWRFSDEVEVRIRVSDESVKERLRRKGARMFVYEYNSLEM